MSARRLGRGLRQWWSTRWRNRGLLDALNDSPAEGWWFERLHQGYTGACCRIRRAGDNALADIPFGSDGMIDTAAVVAHCGANDGFLHTFYGQFNGKHVSQTSNSLQFRIYYGSTQLLKQRPDGKPSFINDGVAPFSVRVESSPPNLGLGGSNHAFSLGVKWRRIAGRNDALPFYLGTISNNTFYPWTVSLTQIRLAYDLGASATVTYAGPVTSINNYQSAVIIQSAGQLNTTNTRYRQNGTELSASSAAAGNYNLQSTAIPGWGYYRDGGNSADRYETSPGMIVWDRAIGPDDTSKLEQFLATYT